MSDSADVLLQKANRLLASAGKGGLFNFFSGGSEDKYEEAADTLVKAAGALMGDGKYKEAAKTYERAAQIYNDKTDKDTRALAPRTYIEAFKMYIYKPRDLESAARCVDFATHYWSRNNNVYMAANKMEPMGDAYVAEVQEIKDKERIMKLRQHAVECYESAAKWFTLTTNANLANRNKVKAAEHAAMNADYQRAAKHYEELAIASKASTTFMRGYFLSNGLCHLAAGDTVAMERALLEYPDHDPGFKESHEGKLLVGLAAAQEAAELNDFEAAEAAYVQSGHSKTQYNQMIFELISRAKKTIPGQAESVENFMGKPVEEPVEVAPANAEADMY
ncbi:Uu.00g074640.m01.CDS01 [Anthostomella pinea]|uniref:Uu.00g074640.m01.CDS01 n=1 Tax=Anthostomella pinea TaxID=933095 RepID=A0AAI8YNY3_9PEZI|nr:Uu.00g074640.m01.CDS01 [Anthostomella pinea]